MILQRISSVLGAAVVVGGLSISAVSPVMAQGAKLGVLMPLTGALAQYGPSSLNGINLALKQINDQGGVLGGKIELVVADSQTNPQAAVNAAKQLSSTNKLSGFVGPLASGETIPVVQSVAAVEGIPLITGSATAPGITTLADNDFAFRTTAHDAVQGVVLSDLVKKRGVKKISIMYRNDDYGKGLSESFSKRFKETGGEVTSNVGFEEKQASYRGELQRASQGGPEALLLIAFPGEGTPLLKQAIEEGLFKKFVFTDGMKSTEDIKAIGAANLNGSYGTAPEAKASDSTRLFREAYQKEHGQLPPLPFIDTLYDAAFILALAIEKAGSSDPKKVRDAIREVSNGPGEAIRPGEWAKAKQLIKDGKKIDYVGSAGSQDFDKAGDVPGSFGIWSIDNGEIKTIEVIEAS